MINITAYLLSMHQLKRHIKKLFFNLGLSKFFDKLIYFINYLKYYKQNYNYVKEHSDIAFPPNYFLYETYSLNYKHYFEDGETSAKEIIEWTKKYLPQNNELKILEWGCGVARTTRHLQNYVSSNSKVYACDINKNMIEWNKVHIKNVEFTLIYYLPVTLYPNNCFNLVFGISIFTHIEAIHQEKWLAEICRILDSNGIFLFSTHGKLFNAKLTNNELKELNKSGCVTVDYYQKGHRLMATYNQPEFFRSQIEKYFEILEYYDGANNFNKLGGQDLWIVRKR